MKRPKKRTIEFEEMPGGTLRVKSLAKDVATGERIWFTSTYGGWADYKKSLHVTLGCRFHVKPVGKKRKGKTEVLVYRGRPFRT